MSILLTGANGFIGSHLLDALCGRGRRVSILLRTTSDTRFIEDRLDEVTVHYGSLSDTESLWRALRGAELVVHCAGKTKAVHASEYYLVNADGTRNLVRAVNARRDGLRHLVAISSVAAAGPGTADRPVREDDPPHPVSHYGRSKLEGERQVRAHCRVPFTILRPAVVYGPRESDLFMMFRAVRDGLVPLIGGGRMRVSAAFVPDVVGAVLAALDDRRAHGQTYHVAGPDAPTMEAFLDALAEVMGHRAWRIRLPVWALYPVCALREVWAGLTGRPGILNLQKMREYEAPGWVCSVEKIRRELGFVASTPLREGLEQTLRWYRRNGWL